MPPPGKDEVRGGPNGSSTFQGPSEILDWEALLRMERSLDMLGFDVVWVVNGFRMKESIWIRLRFISTANAGGMGDKSAEGTAGASNGSRRREKLQ